MRTSRRAAAALVLCLVVAAPAAAALQQPGAPEGFVQVNDVPASEQLPAAPFLMSAYAFFLVLMVGYIWSVARRLNRVEKDMAALQRGPRNPSP